MHSNISIFTTASIPPAQGIDSDCIHRTEMALHAPDLFLKDAMVEARLEFPLPGGGLCYVLGWLAAAYNDEVFFWCDGPRFERGVSDVGFQERKITCG